MLIREFYGNLFLEVTVGEMIMMMKKINDFTNRKRRKIVCLFEKIQIVDAIILLAFHANYEMLLNDSNFMVFIFFFH